jgi:hypothetical protein
MRKGTPEAFVRVLTSASFVMDRIPAADRLAEMGPKAKHLMPAILGGLSARWWDRVLAADLLWQVGGSSGGLKALLDCVRSEEAMGDPNPRPRAYEALARMAPHVPEAGDEFLVEMYPMSLSLGDTLSPVAKLLRVDPVQHRREAVTRKVFNDAVRGLGAKALPTLLADLKGADARRRFVARRLLPAVGTPEALAAHLADFDALGPATLKEITEPGGKGAKITTAEWGPPGRPAAVGSIGMWGPAARAAVPGLIACLKRRQHHWPRDPEAAYEAQTALGRIGPGASEAVPLLMEDMYYDCFAGGDLRVAEILWQIARSPEAFRLMVERLDEGGDAAASRWLAGLGEDAKSAIPVLERVAEWDMKPEHREAAAEALRAIKGRAG